MDSRSGPKTLDGHKDVSWRFLVADMEGRDDEGAVVIEHRALWTLVEERR